METSSYTSSAQLLADHTKGMVMLGVAEMVMVMVMDSAHVYKALSTTGSTWEVQNRHFDAFAEISFLQRGHSRVVGAPSVRTKARVYAIQIHG